MNMPQSVSSNIAKSNVDDSKISIYSCYYGPAKIFENDVIKPLQVGSANSPLRLPMLQDDDGDNISVLNKSFCEMTGIYWAWKNDSTSDHIGFCHYRRLFSFQNNTDQKVDTHGMIYAERIKSDFEKSFGLDLTSAKAAVAKYDIILPHHFEVTNSFGLKTVREQYEASPSHHASHLDLVRRAMFALCPEDLKHLNDALEGAYIYPANMFVMSRSLFNRYCEWIFPLLFWIEDRIDVMGMDAVERRAVGFLAERLLTTYILKLRKSDSTLRIAEFDRVFVRNTSPLPKEPQLPTTSLPVVTVVASTDESYASHMAALAVSIASTISKGTWLDLIILCGTLAEGTRKNLQEIQASFPNMSISFVEMEGEYISAKVHSYFPQATLYRLSIAEILKSRERIIFVDTDGIVTEDISSLGTMDLEGKIVAAVHDTTMESFRNMKVPVMAECGNMDAETYCKTYLGMADASYSYFQAGFLIMDLNALREQNLSDKMVSDVLSRPYWFLDQDILNKYLVGQVKFLDPRWNVVALDARHRSYLSNAAQAELARVQGNPAFIHYAGPGKPWNSTGHARAQDYWVCLRKTPFYETTLLQTSSLHTSQVETLQQHVEALKLQVEFVKSQMDVLQPQLGSLQPHVGGLLQQVAAIKSQVDVIEQRMKKGSLSISAKRIRERFTKLGRSIKKRVRPHRRSS